MNFKLCTKCKDEKFFPEDFSKDKRRPDGRGSWCKNCINKASIKFKKTERGKELERKRASSPKRKRVKNSKRLQREFGITQEGYDLLLSKQEGRCLICNIHYTECKKSLNVDHDHKTGVIRGLLCSSCNRGLGYFKDSIVVIYSAYKYMQRNQYVE